MVKTGTPKIVTLYVENLDFQIMVSQINNVITVRVSSREILLGEKLHAEKFSGRGSRKHAFGCSHQSYLQQWTFRGEKLGFHSLDETQSVMIIIMYNTYRITCTSQRLLWLRINTSDQECLLYWI